MQQQLWGGVVAALLLAGVSGWGDHRRRHRRDMDRVGITPWPLLQFLSLMLALLLASIALHVG